MAHQKNTNGSEVNETMHEAIHEHEWRECGQKLHFPTASLSLHLLTLQRGT